LLDVYYCFGFGPVLVANKILPISRQSSLWRQYFRDQAEAAVELEEEEKEQRSPPARGELASTALRGFVDEHYRSLASATPNHFNGKGDGKNERMLQMRQAARDADQQRLNNPNLSVPSSDGDEYLYLPQ